MKLRRVIDHALDIVFRYVDILDWTISDLPNMFNMVSNESLLSKK